MIEIKNWKTGEVIYSADCETIKEALEKGVKEGVCFNYAILVGANLIGARLNYAGLNYANLYHANLDRASLYSASLDHASFWNCIGNRKEIKSLQIGTYSVTYTKDVLQIGCKQHTFEEWWNFTDKQILQMDGKKALVFWNKYKAFIKTAVELSPARGR